MVAKGPRPKFVSNPRSETEPPRDIEIRLHPTQLAFVECPKIFKSYTGGIGSGKSYVGCYDILAHAEPGSLVAVCAPTYRQLSDSTMRSFVEIATKLGLWDEAKYRKTDNQAMLNNRVEVLFRSADNPASNRGPSLRRAYLDEAGLMDEEMFNVMVGRLRFGGEQGALSSTFTPQGKQHWTYRLFADQNNPNVALFRSSTKDNPFLAPEFYENLLYQYGRGEGGMLRARQELEGEFVQVEGSEWGAECFGPGIWVDRWPTDPEAIRIASLDSSKGIGGKKGDYSCFIKMMCSGEHLYVEADMDNTRNTSAIASTCVEIQRSFQPDIFTIEAEFGGSIMMDDLVQRQQAADVAMNIGLMPTKGIQKEVRILRMTRFVVSNVFRFLDTPGTHLLVDQMEGFSRTPNKDRHDDGPDALEMAVHTAVEAGVFGNVAYEL